MTAGVWGWYYVRTYHDVLFDDDDLWRDVCSLCPVHAEGRHGEDREGPWTPVYNRIPTQVQRQEDEEVSGSLTRLTLVVAKYGDLVFILYTCSHLAMCLPFVCVRNDDQQHCKETNNL